MVGNICFFSDNKFWLLELRIYWNIKLYKMRQNLGTQTLEIKLLLNFGFGLKNKLSTIFSIKRK